ncbi:hypothetical protein R50073_01590 [Maricurvus nonylphenolicus]|uniref:hypothetical protein n=1 Tax=Maricurvus nonylphenolicus TaxID=1008307 RepID=UPI0036F1A13E
MVTPQDFDNGKIRLWSYKGVPVVEPYTNGEITLEDCHWIAQIGVEHFDSPYLINRKKTDYSVSPEAQVFLMEIAGSAEKCAYVVDNQEQFRLAEMAAQTFWSELKTQTFFDMEQAYNWLTESSS